MAARKKLDKATRLATRQGLLVVIVCLLTLEATALLQYYYSRKILSEESTRRAQGQLEATKLHILNVLDQVETAVRNSQWSVEQQLTQPDSLSAVTVRLVASNPVICGSTVALRGRMLAPYSHEVEGAILTSTLATEEYDYPHQEWFVKPLELGEGYWSEPYFDEGGGNILMTTYSVPVVDKKGRTAVFTADVSLEWLSDLIATVKVYPTAFNMVVSREGRIMVSPVETLTIEHNVHDLASSMEDSATFQSLNQTIMAEDSGQDTYKYQGKLHYMFFDKVPRTGWVMSISIPEDEIYGSIKRLGTMVTLLQIVGLLMLILVLYYMVRGQRELRQSEEQKNRIDGELQVARGIQMSMIPKIFPEYPECADVDMFACVIPAKEVGGDLYDFYIREEKLFFCIGDVSGKGVPASLVMAVTRSLFRTVSAHEKSPQRIVSTINASMSDMNETNMFVTLFCGVLDLKNGHLRYCNAGHNAPVLVQKDGNRELPVEPNLPLGVLFEMSFTEQECDLSCGTGLFLYTDGLNEAENAYHQLFGEERMMAALKSGLESRQQIAAMTDAVHAFVAGAEQSDDLTMLYIRFMNSQITEETERHLILHNDIQQIPQLAEFVESVADIAKLDVGMTMSLNLALEEAVTNVIMYAYPPGSDGLVDVEAVIREKELRFILSDSGVAFDPTAAPEADITLDVSERPIGGLGIFLVRNIMDEVTYTRSDDGKNILTMIKKLA
ncbi:MAG: SpoIIE family protein phosphatase [Bacteroidales bacterium]|nr:SpoIIE family protein phosphatase [Bacteroidales bacterium]